ncbi:transposase-like protein [Escherichia phage EC_OE_11]|nr:transposase-like protein [Escherichia phage EC_OE_11]
MAKTPKKRSVTKHASKDGAAKAAPKKQKFDTEAFVFDTPIEKIEEALAKFEERDADPFTEDELYWFGWWVLNLPEAKKRGMKSVPICAKESAVLGLYEKPKRRSKKK